MAPTFLSTEGRYVSVLIFLFHNSFILNTQYFISWNCHKGSYVLLVILISPKHLFICQCCSALMLGSGLKAYLFQCVGLGPGCLGVLHALALALRVKALALILRVQALDLASWVWALTTILSHAYRNLKLRPVPLHLRCISQFWKYSNESQTIPHLTLTCLR